ncbi:MAG: hypothetical protein HZC55_10210 [Verrucomicrobia bacterium]|nr:hypothetical protein [Verrucomicrobiota bacterium]
MTLASPDLLAQIRRLDLEHGRASAIAFTRVAYERGHLGDHDIAEVLLALYSRTWQRLEASGRLARADATRMSSAA